MKTKLKESVILEDVENECILVDLESATYLSLNKAAMMMTLAIRDTGDTGVAIDKILEYTEVDRDTLERDMDKFVNELKELELVE